MADIAKLCMAGHPRPRVLIGGLGLGFTLAAIQRDFADDVEITVCEISADVLRWYRQYFKPTFFADLNDAHVRFLNFDIRDLREGGFDLILLDVDNGPEAISADTNAELYDVAGLRKLACTADQILIWSAFRSPDFESTAESAGFQVKCFPVEVGWREHEHFIYGLTHV